MIVHDCAQGSTEWFLLRAGKPTASEFDSLITPLRKPRTGEGRETYLLTKVAEKCMGMPAQSYSGGPMEQGSILEGEALPWLEFAHGVKVNRVGFCETDDKRIGCSPPRWATGPPKEESPSLRKAAATSGRLGAEAAAGRSPAGPGCCGAAVISPGRP